MSGTFQAVIARQDENKKISCQLETIEESSLPEGDVLIAVEYSCLNYKDALGITGTGPIFKTTPMIPGVDASGTVIESQSEQFQVGQKVILNGFGVGEVRYGTLSEKLRVRSEWLIPLPEKLTPWQAMASGTAGYTAMLCVMALEQFGVQKEKEIVVTGATGGVGSFAVALLARLGYRVVAVTGSPQEAYLKSLGAEAVLGRETLALTKRPLLAQRWGGAVDTVGGEMLASLLAQMHYEAPVAACGLAGSAALPTTVMPFILRGVRLIGVDSVYRSLAVRQEAWSRLADLLDARFFEKIVPQTVSLSESIQAAHALMRNEICGRVVVKVQ